MTVIATASNPRFHVSRADIDRDGPTYTVDTLRDLHALYGPSRPTCSSSPAPTRWRRILSWKDALEMLSLAHFVGVTRPGFELSDKHLPADSGDAGRGARDGHLVERLPGPGGLDGKPVWYLVPDGVVQYIAKRGLYRGSGNVGPACERLVTQEDLTTDGKPLARH